jgi:hypothetical protein
MLKIYLLVLSVITSTHLFSAELDTKKLLNMRDKGREREILTILAQHRHSRLNLLMDLFEIPISTKQNTKGHFITIPEVIKLLEKEEKTGWQDNCADFVCEYPRISPCGKYCVITQLIDNKAALGSKKASSAHDKKKKAFTEKIKVYSAAEGRHIKTFTAHYHKAFLKETCDTRQAFGWDGDKFALVVRKSNPDKQVMRVYDLLTKQRIAKTPLTLPHLPGDISDELKK